MIPQNEAPLVSTKTTLLQICLRVPQEEPDTYQRFFAVDGRPGAFGDDFVDALFVDSSIAL